MSEYKQTWTKVRLNDRYLKELRDYYSLPWYKRLFRRAP